MTTQDKETAKGPGPQPEVRVLVLGPFQSNCYLLSCPETKETVVIDPGAEANAITRVIDQNGLKVTAIVSTHGHVDHVSAAQALKEATGAPVLLHQADVPMLRSPLLGLSNLLPGARDAAKTAVDRELSDGDTLTFGSMSLAVCHSPGHSPGGICLVLELEPAAPSLCFSGDTLFAGSVGRTDFPGGDWKTLEDSVRRVIYSLPDRTLVLPGHGPETSVGRERRSNPFVPG